MYYNQAPQALIYQCSQRTGTESTTKGRDFYNLSSSAAGDLINRRGSYGSKTSGYPPIVTSISLPTLVVIKQGLANYGLWPKLDSQTNLAHSPFQFTVFCFLINKDLLKCNYTYLFVYGLQLLSS